MSCSLHTSRHLGKAPFGNVPAYVQRTTYELGSPLSSSQVLTGKAEPATPAPAPPAVVQWRKVQGAGVWVGFAVGVGTDKGTRDDTTMRVPGCGGCSPRTGALGAQPPAAPSQVGWGLGRAIRATRASCA